MRDRLALLSLLRPLGPRVVAGLAAAMLLVTLLPALTAGSLGWLVARAVVVARDGAGLGTLTAPLLLVAVVLFLDLLAPDLVQAFRDWTALRVNGEVRKRVRRALSSPAGIAHVEDQAMREAAGLPAVDTASINIGTGAQGQLWLLARFAGAAASAGLVALYSPWVAAAVLGCMLVQRRILVKQYSTIVRELPQMHRAGRGADYWEQVAGGTAGAQESRIFGFGPWATAEFGRHADARADVMQRVMNRGKGMHWAVFGLSAGSAGLAFGLVTASALDGDLTPARLATTIGGVLGLSSMGVMGFEAIYIAAALRQLAALRTVDGLLDDGAGPAGQDGPGGPGGPTVPGALAAPPVSAAFYAPAAVVRRKDLGRVGASITFEDVWFRYPGTERDVLRGLDLHIPAGDSVAIVGENGVGKTTLLKLLCGFFTPTRGRILIDGADIGTVPPAHWRDRIAVVFQDFARLELSARDNIGLAALGRGAPDEAALREAAGAVGILERIEALPRGWDSVLSPAYKGGGDLSGGQWQRIALARALYAADEGAGVLVLDEPTAALDVTAETELFDRLMDTAHDLTNIVVSHRFSTVRRAARIVVVADGKVAEDGSHAALMELGGMYRTLHELQAERFRQAETDVDADAAAAADGSAAGGCAQADSEEAGR
ncbi:ABC transporter ATP-binding protein [Yinghuangia soli]|uniref:ATP-binding cassette domain-containing protein n=1 Tax=Yinghuangia soli TaxID=2908204 RepID=A0AA41PZD6_9ACTN|nr:ATP-binding cassette domain-containing protein [Yinghuangia soli]MCF2528461.1 ATP-binding cassette domain-containing protein [Yinghuangia soli]